MIHDFESKELTLGGVQFYLDGEADYNFNVYNQLTRVEVTLSRVGVCWETKDNSFELLPGLDRDSEWIAEAMGFPIAWLQDHLCELWQDDPAELMEDYQSQLADDYFGRGEEA
jgi:hypothetical protein